MKKSIEVIIDQDGGIKIEAVGFVGADCDKATRFLEQALGSIAGKTKKPEYAQTAAQPRKATI